MWSIHACICGTYMHAYHICMHVYAWNVSKTDFNTKILLSSWIMHRFQRFLMFWKAECFLFHLETTFPRCFVFVCSKTWHLWKVCLIYWTNRGSSIPVLIKFLSQNTGNTAIYLFWIKCSKNNVLALTALQISAPTDHYCKSHLQQKNIWGIKSLTVEHRRGHGFGTGFEVKCLQNRLQNHI